MAKPSDKTPSPASPPPLRVLPMWLQLGDLLEDEVQVRVES